MSRLGRRLAFDYGDVRIGVAVCDIDGILATPLHYLLSKDPGLNTAISQLCSEYEPVKIYVGLPLNLSGEESESSKKAKAFASAVSKVASCPIEMVDERLTTSSASTVLSQAGLSAKDQRKQIDSQAAVMILEFGLAKDRG
ncbi:MAG: Holliday junction resolvase RuvX [Candidatus Planktophila sp.]